jgi:hypothetical protein
MSGANARVGRENPAGAAGPRRAGRPPREVAMFDSMKTGVRMAGPTALFALVAVVAAVTAVTALPRVPTRRGPRGATAPAHVRHRDILMATIAAAMSGSIPALADFTRLFGGRVAGGRPSNRIASMAVAILAPFAAMPIPIPGATAGARH